MVRTWYVKKKMKLETESVTSAGVSPRYIPSVPSCSKASISWPIVRPYLRCDSDEACVAWGNEGVGAWDDGGR